MGTRRPDRPFGVELKTAFIEAACHIVIERGPNALSVWAVVAAVDPNASHTAAYAFFRGRGPEVLAAVAATGFVDLLDALADKRTSSAANPVTDVVQRYVRFGVRNANLYRAMFHASLAPALSLFESETPEPVPGFETYQDLYGLKMNAFEVIVSAVDALAAGGSKGNGNSEDGALAVAALAHGLVGEFIDEGLGWRDAVENPWSPSRQQMTRRVTEIMLRGLAK